MNIVSLPSIRLERIPMEMSVTIFRTEIADCGLVWKTQTGMEKMTKEIK